MIEIVSQAMHGPMVGQLVQPCPQRGTVIVTLNYGDYPLEHDARVQLDRAFTEMQVEQNDTTFVIEPEGEETYRVTVQSEHWCVPAGYAYVGRGKKSHHTHIVVPLIAGTGIWFHRDDNLAVIEDLQLEQGQHCRIQLCVTGDTLANHRVRLFLPGTQQPAGQAQRPRPAARSMNGADYRYLSRVRIAAGQHGMQRPMDTLLANDCEDSFARGSWEQAEPGRYLVHSMTLVSLEHGNGDEPLTAQLLNAANAVVAETTLTIQPTAPARPLGSLWPFQNNNNVEDYLAADTHFEAIYQQSGGFRANSIVIGIADTGIYDDEGDHNYLAPRIRAGRYFDLDPANDAAVAPDDGLHLLLESPSKHGTNVAANASWGSDRIKLVDIMLQRGHLAAMLNAATTARALTWAGQQGVSIVNCSKILPFNTDVVNAVVQPQANVLYIATTGNRSFEYPADLTTLTAEALRGSDLNPDQLPRSHRNTLFVAGCTTQGTHANDRGYGPGTDIMAPADGSDLYSPMRLVLRYRARDIDRFRTAWLNKINEEMVETDANQQQVVQITAAELDELNGLIALPEPPNAMVRMVRERKFKALVAKRDEPPVNPLYERRQAYIAVNQVVVGWQWPDNVDEQPRVAQQWLTTFLHWQQTAPAQEPPAQRDVRTSTFLQEQMTVRGIAKVDTDLQGAESHLADDVGVSFGLPLVANLAAKAKLIRSTLTANQLRRLLIDTSDSDPNMADECLAGGLINPLRAYFAAYDNDVTSTGTDVRNPA